MPPNAPEDLNRTIETLYRSESGRILATLVRLLGDLDLAEEAMHEAFAAALETWPQTGLPDKPRPWLISAGRFKVTDVMRRRQRFDAAQSDLALQLEARVNEAPQEEEMEDDRLRLIFTCCHPALPSEGQVALTLREFCGLTTEEIAEHFSLRRRHLLNASFARKPPSAISGFLIKCPCRRNYQRGWGPYFRLCTWSSTRVIQRKQQELN
jgi:RNA polymerase sigma-70 factor (ECF subfamily)